LNLRALLYQHAASRADPNNVATIVMRSGKNGCQQRSFNNQTGQISDQSSQCHNDVVLDAKGVPISAGTIHTLNIQSANRSNNDDACYRLDHLTGHDLFVVARIRQNSDLNYNTSLSIASGIRRFSVSF
jgi:hypothetical protein